MHNNIPYDPDSYDTSRRPSIPRNRNEQPRNGYYPEDYSRVSPMPGFREPGFPDFSRMPGGQNSHYPKGQGRRNGGFYQGGGPGEWEFWR
jgi:hypothetical protein